MDSVTKNYLDSPSKNPLDSVSKNSIDITGLVGDDDVVVAAVLLTGKPAVSGNQRGDGQDDDSGDGAWGVVGRIHRCGEEGE